MPTKTSEKKKVSRESVRRINALLDFLGETLLAKTPDEPEENNTKGDQKIIDDQEK